MAIWDGFVKILEMVLRFFYEIPPNNAGLSIIFFTIIVKVLLLPLTITQLRSAREMQKLQPKIRELQKKYAKDREKLNQETMALYREHGVNPMQGCLPSLLQLPIFFGVYFAIMNLSRIPSAATLVGRWAGFDSLSLLGLGSIPEYIATGLERGVFADKPFLWMSSMGNPDPLHILPILAGLLQLIQQKMMATQNADPQQKAMSNAMMFMPLFFVYIGWTFPAGPVIYWVTQSFVGIVQQYFTTGWGGLTQWLPFLPERKPPEDKPRPRPKDVDQTGEARPKKSWLWQLMDRASTAQQQLNEDKDVEEPPPTSRKTGSSAPPAPSKRRSRR